MKNLLLLILALSLVFGCVQETPAAQNDVPAVANESQGPVQNESLPAGPNDNTTATQPADNGTAATSAPAETGEVVLEVGFTEVDLTTITIEIRKPNPECYPDAQKCMMEEMPMHIFEDVEHTFYNLSSKGDICLVAPGADASSTTFYLVEYTIENQDSMPHSANPELLVKTENTKMGYLVSSPYSKTNCTSFYDDSDLDIDFGPAESMDFKAVLIIPKTEAPLTASVYVDGEK